MPFSPYFYFPLLLDCKNWFSIFPVHQNDYQDLMVLSTEIQQKKIKKKIQRQIQKHKTNFHDKRSAYSRLEKDVIIETDL